jgi:hypothetical protein
MASTNTVESMASGTSQDTVATDLLGLEKHILARTHLKDAFHALVKMRCADGAQAGATPSSHCTHPLQEETQFDLLKCAANSEQYELCTHTAMEIWLSRKDGDTCDQVEDAKYILKEAFRLALTNERMPLSHRNAAAFCRLLMFSMCQLADLLMLTCILEGPQRTMACIQSVPMICTILGPDVQTRRSRLSTSAEREHSNQRDYVPHRLIAMLGLHSQLSKHVKNQPMRKQLHKSIAGLLHYIIVNNHWHKTHTFQPVDGELGYDVVSAPTPVECKELSDVQDRGLFQNLVSMSWVYDQNQLADSDLEQSSMWMYLWYGACGNASLETSCASWSEIMWMLIDGCAVGNIDTQVDHPREVAKACLNWLLYDSKTQSRRLLIIAMCANSLIMSRGARIQPPVTIAAAHRSDFDIVSVRALLEDAKSRGGSWDQCDEKEPERVSPAELIMPFEPSCHRDFLEEAVVSVILGQWMGLIKTRYFPPTSHAASAAENEASVQQRRARHDSLFSTLTESFDQNKWAFRSQNAISANWTAFVKFTRIMQMLGRQGYVFFQSILLESATVHGCGMEKLGVLHGRLASGSTTPGMSVFGRFLVDLLVPIHACRWEDMADCTIEFVSLMQQACPESTILLFRELSCRKPSANDDVTDPPVALNADPVALMCARAVLASCTCDQVDAAQFVKWMETAHVATITSVLTVYAHASAQNHVRLVCGLARLAMSSLVETVVMHQHPREADGWKSPLIQQEELGQNFDKHFQQIVSSCVTPMLRACPWFKQDVEAGGNYLPRPGEEAMFLETSKAFMRQMQYGLHNVYLLDDQIVQISRELQVAAMRQDQDSVVNHPLPQRSLAAKLLWAQTMGLVASQSFECLHGKATPANLEWKPKLRTLQALFESSLAPTSPLEYWQYAQVREVLCMQNATEDYESLHQCMLKMLELSLTGSLNYLAYEYAVTPTTDEGMASLVSLFGLELFAQSPMDALTVTETVRLMMAGVIPRTKWALVLSSHAKDNDCKVFAQSIAWELITMCFAADSPCELLLDGDSSPGNDDIGALLLSSFNDVEDNADESDRGERYQALLFDRVAPELFVHMNQYSLTARRCQLILSLLRILTGHRGGAQGAHLKKFFLERFVSMIVICWGDKSSSLSSFTELSQLILNCITMQINVLGGHKDLRNCQMISTLYD